MHLKVMTIIKLCTLMHLCTFLVYVNKHNNCFKNCYQQVSVQNYFQNQVLKYK